MLKYIAGTTLLICAALVALGAAAQTPDLGIGGIIPDIVKDACANNGAILVKILGGALSLILSAIGLANVQSLASRPWVGAVINFCAGNFRSYLRNAAAAAAKTAPALLLLLLLGACVPMPGLFSSATNQPPPADLIKALAMDPAGVCFAIPASTYVPGMIFARGGSGQIPVDCTSTGAKIGPQGGSLQALPAGTVISTPAASSTIATPPPAAKP